MEHNINVESENIHAWLCANMLSLNDVEKSNFVIFHPLQKKIGVAISLQLNDKSLRKVDRIKYLGVFIDTLTWAGKLTSSILQIKSKEVLAFSRE